MRLLLSPWELILCGIQVSVFSTFILEDYSIIFALAAMNKFTIFDQ